MGQGQPWSARGRGGWLAGGRTRGLTVESLRRQRLAVCLLVRWQDHSIVHPTITDSRVFALTNRARFRSVIAGFSDAFWIAKSGRRRREWVLAP